MVQDESEPWVVKSSNGVFRMLTYLYAAQFAITNSISICWSVHMTTCVFFGVYIYAYALWLCYIYYNIFIYLYIFIYNLYIYIFKYYIYIKIPDVNIYKYIYLHLDLNKVLNTCHNDRHCKLYYSPLLVLEDMNISKIRQSSWVDCMLMFDVAMFHSPSE